MNDKHLDLITDRVTPFLKNCFIEDIRTIETSSVTNRIKLITERAFETVDFKSDTIKGLLKEFFKKKTKEMLDNCTSNKPDDENGKKIEKIAFDCVPDILDGELFDQDDEWLDKYIEGQLTMFVHGLLKHYFDIYFQKIEFAMLKNWDDAELLTFGKEQSRFKMSELDAIIKSGQGFNAWLDKKRKGKLILREMAEEYSYKEHNKLDEGFVDKLVDQVKACQWNPGFRTFCLEKYDNK